MTRYGVEVTFVDMADLDAVKKAMKPNTRVVYLETPANPTLKITDIHAVKYYKNTGMYDALHRDREQYIIGTVYVDTPQDIRYLKEASGWPLFACGRLKPCGRRKRGERGSGQHRRRQQGIPGADS